MDVHGAGAQRSDVKVGDASRYSEGRGPQGDAMRIYNLVRCVRGGAAEAKTDGPKVEMRYARPGGGGHDGRGAMGEIFMGEARGDGPPAGEMFIRMQDQNGDQRVSADEFRGPSEHFARFDRNGDGYISLEEAPTGRPMGERGGENRRHWRRPPG